MKALKLAVAEPSAILRCGIIAVLRRLPAPDVDILEIADISQLTAQLSRHRPDVLVVNPASLGFCTPQQLRVQTGCEGLRCIALQMSVTDAATLNAYDDVLSVYDPVETLREKIRKRISCSTQAWTSASDLSKRTAVPKRKPSSQGFPSCRAAGSSTKARNSRRWTRRPS